MDIKRICDTFSHSAFTIDVENSLGIACHAYQFRADIPLTRKSRNYRWPRRYTRLDRSISRCSYVALIIQKRNRASGIVAIWHLSNMTLKYTHASNKYKQSDVHRKGRLKNIHLNILNSALYEFFSTNLKNILFAYVSLFLINLKI